MVLVITVMATTFTNAQRGAKLDADKTIIVILDANGNPAHK
jgi:hypothetical protein